MLGRAGRFRPVHESLEVKVVVVGEGERRRRYIVCNLVEAVRQRQHREEGLAALRQELARLDPQAPTTPSGPASWLPQALRPLSEPGVPGAGWPSTLRPCAVLPGWTKYVLLTNDDTLSPRMWGWGTRR